MATDSTKRAVVGIGLTVAGVLATCWWLQGSFTGWHHDDDFKNLRWVLEYRDEPWLALLERHQLHDHIRPVSLLSHWLGFTISDGAWWGAHAVLAGWVALALGGVMALSRALGGRWLAMGLALWLALGAVGTDGGLLTWNSWIGQSAEVAGDLWALAAGVWALGGGPSWAAVASIGAVVLAGLSKEPGWLVAPTTLGLGALQPPRRWRWLVALGGVMVAGLLFTATSANVARYDVLSNPGRLLVNARHLAAGMVESWPRDLSRAGMSAPALVLALLVSWGWPGRGRIVGAVLGGLALVGLALSRDVAVVLPLVLALTALARREWVLLAPVVAWGVMLPNQGPDPAFVVAGTLVLCAWSAARLEAWLDGSRTRVVLVALVGLWGGAQGLDRVLDPPEVRGEPEALDDLGPLAGLTAALAPVDITQQQNDHFRAGLDLLGPLLGVTGASGGGAGQTWVNAGYGVRLHLADGARLSGLLTQPGAVVAPAQQVQDLTLPPGCVAIGVLPVTRIVGEVQTRWNGPCLSEQREVTLEAGMRASLLGVQSEGCTVQVRGMPAEGYRVFAVGLEQCRLSLARGDNVQRLLPVQGEPQRR